MTSDRAAKVTDPKTLLGEQVRVKLAEKVIVIGKLLSFSDGGELTIEDSSGFVHYCWPMLHVERAIGPHDAGRE